ncbi:hypothetical protein [Paracidovorax citrulli]|uniref:hypothetical protein n=1 Tax=Paracidovorax citrulli TaxID=80869 RepID=UPI0005FABF99|nr:hypothetical protein [Paracidovorax citrulli]
MRKPDIDTVRDTLKALVMLAALIGGGVGIGYGIGTERARAVLLQEREDRIAEITRLQDSYRTALDAIGGRQARTADRVADAAETASTAAETAKAAATTANKAARAAGVPATAADHDRAVNNTIHSANQRIRQGSR